MNEETFKQEVEKLGIVITKTQLRQLNNYYQLLIEWNEKINLTRITEKEDVFLKHFYDSLTIIKVVNLNEQSTLCDVGTGAGFPGIVLKIFFPHLKVTLIDSLNKRIIFLNEVITRIGLKDIEAIHARGEEYKGKFDIVTSRAVANIEKLVNYTMHLVSKEGKFVAMKGNIDDELTEVVRKKIEKKYNIIKIDQFKLPIEESNRSLIVLNNK